MRIPSSIIVNADDIGLRPSVNKAILYSFQQGYINSTSLLTNMDCFDQTVDFIHNNPSIINIGLHGNFAEGRPVSNFKYHEFLDDDGNWNISKTSRVSQLLTKELKAAFAAELDAQLNKALSAKINITHVDSHLHLHTLPAFYNIYIDVAKCHKLKLRLAQTYREGSYVKFLYRSFLNNKIKSAHINYSDLFETVSKFLNRADRGSKTMVEIMVHPDFDQAGKLIDHVDGISMDYWVDYLKNINTTGAQQGNISTL